MPTPEEVIAGLHKNASKFENRPDVPMFSEIAENMREAAALIESLRERLAVAKKREMNYVYVIAQMSMGALDYDSPVIGDWVVECSHLIGMPKKEPIGLSVAIGKIISQESSSVYVLRLLDGKEQRWENAMMRKLPSLDAASAKERG